MERKVIIFDFDGTIADSLSMIYKASNDALESYHGKRITPEEIEELKKKGIKNALKKLNVSVIRLPFLVLKIQLKMYDRIDEVEPFSGVQEMITELEEEFVLGIFTNNRKKTVKKFLKKNDLESFDFIVDNPFLRKKDKKLKKFSKRNAIAYVGDQKADMAAAKKVGLSAVGVSWGFDSSRDLSDGGADFIAKSPEEIVSFVKDPEV